MFELLVYIILGLIAAALWQVVRVSELAISLKGADPNKVTEKDNRMNGRLMMLFYVILMVTFVWQCMAWSKFFLPEAASEHGAKIDSLMNFNMYGVVVPVFVIVNGVLFYMAWKYHGRDGARATFYPHNNKLEMAWTITPALFLAIIIFWGLRVWNDVTAPAPQNTKRIELVAKQFDWAIRYAGDDNTLGRANYKLVTNDNALGVDTTDKAYKDDFQVKDTAFHILKGQSYEFMLRSKDVIHSAYMPYFRQQMNCVPGLVTSYHFVPTISTKEMREKLNDPTFNYYLICNKICGQTHYNMKFIIIVDDPKDIDKNTKMSAYDNWLTTQVRYDGKPAKAKPEEKKKEEKPAEDTNKKDSGTGAAAATAAAEKPKSH